MQKSRFTLRALTEGAVFVALAQVISYLKLFELPQGGSITVAMLPIFLYCARWGFGPGMLASFVYSLLLPGRCIRLGLAVHAWRLHCGLHGSRPRRSLPQPEIRILYRYRGWQPRPFSGALCSRRYGLGGIHAGDLLWPDHALPVVLFFPVQRQLYDYRYAALSGNRSAALEAFGQVYPRRGSEAEIIIRKSEVLFQKSRADIRIRVSPRYSFLFSQTGIPYSRPAFTSSTLLRIQSQTFSTPSPVFALIGKKIALGFKARMRSSAFSRLKSK